MTRKLILAATLFVLAVGCENVLVGPFVPPHPKPCSWEGDCPKHYTCAFPGVNTRAVCMEGENFLDENVGGP